MNLARSAGLGNAMNLNGYNTRPSKFRGACGHASNVSNKDETAREIKFPDLDETT